MGNQAMNIFLRNMCMSEKRKLNDRDMRKVNERLMAKSKQINEVPAPKCELRAVHEPSTSRRSP